MVGPPGPSGEQGAAGQHPGQAHVSQLGCAERPAAAQRQSRLPRTELLSPVTDTAGEGDSRFPTGTSPGQGAGLGPGGGWGSSHQAQSNACGRCQQPGWASHKPRAYGLSEGVCDSSRLGLLRSRWHMWRACRCSSPAATSMATFTGLQGLRRSHHGREGGDCP